MRVPAIWHDSLCNLDRCALWNLRLLPSSSRELGVGSLESSSSTRSYRELSILVVCSCGCLMRQAPWVCLFLTLHPHAPPTHPPAERSEEQEMHIQSLPGSNINDMLTSMLLAAGTGPCGRQEAHHHRTLPCSSFTGRALTSLSLAARWA